MFFTIPLPFLASNFLLSCFKSKMAATVGQFGRKKRSNLQKKILKIGIQWVDYCSINPLSLYFATLPQNPNGQQKIAAKMATKMAAQICPILREKSKFKKMCPSCIVYRCK